MEKWDTILKNIMHYTKSRCNKIWYPFRNAIFNINVITINVTENVIKRVKMNLHLQYNMQ